MNKNIFSMKQQQYDERTLPEWYSLRGLTSWLAASKPMCSAAKLYSFMLDETVTARQAVYYFYAQLAALSVFFPANLNAGWRACAFLLFCRAISFTRLPR